MSLLSELHVHVCKSGLLSSLLLGLLVMILIRALVSRRKKSSLNLPRGPAAIPVLGNMLSLRDHDGLLKQLCELEQEYGPVFSLKLGRKLVVVVSSLEKIREVLLGGLDFGDRGSQIGLWKEMNPHQLGIFESPANDQWKTQRKFAHTTLRGMGFGKVLLEPVVREEVDGVIKHLKENGENGIDPAASFGVGASNIISRLVISRRLDHESDTADEFVANIRAVMTDNNNSALLMIFPFLWPVIRFTQKYRTIAGAAEKVSEFVEQEIAVRQQRIDAAQGDPEIHDFMDAYLVNRKESPDTFSLESLVQVILDLFLAGTDTTSTTLTWATIYLATHPDIQQKIHNEIIEEVGCEDISMSHRSSLPYTQAALLEVQRIASLAPLIPRMTNTNAELGGFNIPKETAILVNLWSLHHDPKVWPEPMVFKPDRFLDAEGKLKQSDYFLPFSAGKRNCMGEQLAKMELFLFFTSMVQQLKFSVLPECGVPSYDGVLGIVRQPRPFQIKVTPWPVTNELKT